MDNERMYLIIVDCDKATGNLIFAKDLLSGERTEYIEEAQKFTLTFCRELELTHSFGNGNKGYFSLKDNNYEKRTKMYVRGDVKE